MHRLLVSQTSPSSNSLKRLSYMSQVKHWPSPIWKAWLPEADTIASNLYGPSEAWDCVWKPTNDVMQTQNWCLRIGTRRRDRHIGQCSPILSDLAVRSQLAERSWRTRVPLTRPLSEWKRGCSHWLDMMTVLTMVLGNGDGRISQPKGGKDRQAAILLRQVVGRRNACVSIGLIVLERISQRCGQSRGRQEKAQAPREDGGGKQKQADSADAAWKAKRRKGTQERL